MNLNQQFEYNRKGLISFAEQVELDVFTKNATGIVKFTFDFYQYKQLGLVVAIEASDGRNWHLYNDGSILPKSRYGNVPKTVLADVKSKLAEFIGDYNPLEIALPNWVTE